jgi:hypothetical protein
MYFFKPFCFIILFVFSLFLLSSFKHISAPTNSSKSRKTKKILNKTSKSYNDADKRNFHYKEKMIGCVNFIKEKLLSVTGIQGIADIIL